MTATTADVCTSPTPRSLSGYKHYRCRCNGCRAASALHTRNRKRQLAYGRWQPLVDAEPARAHIHALKAAGIGRRRIAELAGVSEHTIGSIIGGRPGRGPNKRIRPNVESAILAIGISSDVTADGAWVDATGSRRRTHALMAIGWSIAAQARRLGRDPTNHTEILTVPVVRAGTARAIRDMYEQMWDTPPPPSASRTKALRYAREHGYAPPLAWDDIDDPDATPHVAAEPDALPDHVLVGRAIKEQWPLVRIERRIDRAAVVAALAETGLGQSSIASRLKSSRPVIRKLLTEECAA